MALSDDVPVRITFPDYKPEGKSDLETWLRKEAEDIQAERVERALRKSAEKLENNESSQQRPVAVHKDPPMPDGSNTNGHWGELPNMDHGRQEPFHQNNATYAESSTDRQDLVRRLFSSFPSAERQTQQQLSESLSHARSGDFTSHGVLLQSKTKEGAAPSLSERVRALLR